MFMAMTLGLADDESEALRRRSERSSGRLLVELVKPPNARA